jgi:hypothetical protein
VIRAPMAFALVRLVWLVALLSLGAALVSPRAALAQGSGLDLTAHASASTVEVGEPFSVELKAISDSSSSTAGDPELRAPSNFTVSGPRVSSQSYMQLGPGGSVVKTGIGATWQLVAAAPGSFVIPGPSVVWRGKRMRANSISVEVVAATGRPRRQSPFLFPGGPSLNFPWPFGGQSEPAEEDPEDSPGTSQDLAMATAPDPNLFLRAVAEKKSAVVGEQVTIAFYVYYRVDFEMTERREAPLSDFVRVPLLKNPGADPPVYAVAGGRKYAVRLLDKIAIFPVRAGELHTGSMSARFAGRRLGSRVLKLSDDLVVNATEPPTEGRPAGYALGDVGKFTISAAVQPRKVDIGGSVAVTLRVQGTGNFPQSLRLPERTGIEWLDPEKRESIDAVEGKVGGFRSFGYVARVKESGKVELGQVELPFWNPEARRYEVAGADLGSIEVRPLPAPTSSGQAGAGKPGPTGDDERSSDPFKALPSARLTLGAYTPPAPPLLDGSRFFWLLAAPPLLFGLFTAGARGARVLKERRAAGQTSPATLAERALKDAEAAEARGDAKDLAGALERAIHHSIEHATGLRARGVLLGELPAELTKRGLDADLAARACDALAACESIRFDPAASAEAIHELRARSQAITRDLSRRKAA